MPRGLVRATCPIGVDRLGGLLPSVRVAIDFVAETLNSRGICWETVL